MREHLAEAIHTLQKIDADIAWEPAQKLHCTLKFLGDSSDKTIIGIGDAIHILAEDMPPFELTATIVGAFPHWRGPRIIWAGLEDSTGGLVKFQKRLDRSLASIGFTMEEREFTPHITLGRVNTLRNIPELLQAAENVTFPIDHFTSGHIHIVKSDLTPTGSVFSIMKSFPLVGKVRV